MGVNGLPRLTSVRACASTAIWLPPRPGWLAAIWKVRSAASAEGTKRELPALVDRCSTERCGGGAVTSGRRHHPGRRGDRVIRAAHRRHRRRRVHRGLALLRSCQRSASAGLPGPPGFPRPPRGVLAILGTAPDSGTSSLTIWKRWPMSGVRAVAAQARPPSPWQPFGGSWQMVGVVSVRSSNNCCCSAGAARNPLPVWLPAGR
jgi:hypothetical protein